MAEEEANTETESSEDSESKGSEDTRKSYGDSQERKARGRTGGARSSRSRMGKLATQGAMQVEVDDNIERAMKILKRKLIKEGLFKELKSRRFYEKPSDRRKRKHKESLKKIRKEEARQKKNPYLFV